jgi:hypothetical protein
MKGYRYIVPGVVCIKADREGSCEYSNAYFGSTERGNFCINRFTIRFSINSMIHGGSKLVFHLTFSKQVVFHRQ